MSDLLPPLDELAAVNELLSSIGQAPVASLSSPIAGDPTMARTFLTNATRAVLSVGFEFNTDEGYTLTPDVDGFLKVPNGVLEIWSDDPSRKLKRRRHPAGFWAIWNADDQTWVFDAPVDFTVFWAFKFEDIPDTARLYITISAGRRFQMRMIGSNALDGFNASDEASAWDTLLRSERRTRRTNAFSRNATLAAQAANRSY